ncbi:desiccation protectant protein Lea14 homolog [Diospyros lotus]|uniref:desiccation protectant protein Lea14 homolog n=1 Tax=Diospyros lotus TaxID=55363 RepID=UPI00225483F6|nr:desiccation protectant protein Lea14 homolog [Diospyros lotus]
MADLVDKAKQFVAEKVANIPMPEATINDLDFKDIDRSGVTYAAKVDVNNPYIVPIPICEISFVLKSSGRVIASGTIPDPGSLKANGKTLLDVPVKVSHSILVSLVRDIATDWDIDYELELRLIIDLPVVGNFTIPLSTMGEVKLPTLSDWWNSDSKE